MRSQSTRSLGCLSLPKRLVSIFAGFDMTLHRARKAVVSDAQFSPGPWTGFYTYAPSDKHRMDLHLDFSSGCIAGDGNDDVARFMIRGKYDASSWECYWIKTYPGGSHDVYYRGWVNKGTGPCAKSWRRIEHTQDSVPLPTLPRK